MDEKTFDYIYDLLFFKDEEYEWWEHEGYYKLGGYLENLNEVALKTLINFSESWSPSIRFHLAEAIIETGIKSSFEIYCKIFIAMEDDDSAHWMSGRLEYTEPADLNPEMWQEFQDKMAEMEKYDTKKQEELNDKGKIIQLNRDT